MALLEALGADGLDRLDFRFEQSSSIIAFASIHLIPMSMMKKRCNSTKLSEYVSVASMINVLTSAQNMIPFAVVGSERNVIIGGRAVRGRKTRWGVVNVEDETHCEFGSLRNFLTR